MADNITLGPCHYDIDEVAVAVAVHESGEGWIPVCDDHKKQAEKEGYEIRPDVDEEDRATSSKQKSKDDDTDADRDTDASDTDASDVDDKSDDNEKSEAHS